MLLAGPRSFCAGVERAIQTVERALDRFGAPVYVRRQIVHNRHVVSPTSRRGAPCSSRSSTRCPTGPPWCSRPTGSPRRSAPRPGPAGSAVIDATCPLVAKVHHEVRRFRQRGYQVVLIGHAGHDETEGTLGEAAGIALIETADDVDAPRARRSRPKVAYVTQTTLVPRRRAADLVGALPARFPDLVGPHAADICYATQNRQDAVRAMARRLRPGAGRRVRQLVQHRPPGRGGPPERVLAPRCSTTSRELELRWLAGAVTRRRHRRRVGAPSIWSSAWSTALGGLGPLEVDERSGHHRTRHFPLPLEVR